LPRRHARGVFTNLGWPRGKLCRKMRGMNRFAARTALLVIALAALLPLGGCASIVVGAATTAVGVVVDVGVGAVKLTGKAVGAVFGSSEDEKKSD
jgi:hypothetical protein